VRGPSTWLRRAWDGQGGFLGRVTLSMLRPVEALFLWTVALRNRGYDLGIFAESNSRIPIISVGNLAVGGTGKTPVASWLVAHLSAMGRRPALVTRGYGSDEVLFHRSRNPGVPVVVHKSKLEAVEQARKVGADVAVLDDGFQHRAASRNVDIVLLAAEQGAEGPLLPRGRFREPLSALSRADAIVITRKVATWEEACAVGRSVMSHGPQAVLGQIHLAEHGWTDLEDYILTGSEDGASIELGGTPPLVPPLGRPRGDFLAVSSVAEPDGFHRLVRSGADGAVECMAFPDHHPFDSDDIRRIVERAAGRAVVTTEKDAVKLGKFSQQLPKTYVLHLQVAWDFGQDAVMELIMRALDKYR
jgi:tetraacyldisaccharide 4'-kinase